MKSCQLGDARVAFQKFYWKSQDLDGEIHRIRTPKKSNKILIMVFVSVNICLLLITGCLPVGSRNWHRL
jgi:hypothetical protein